MIDGSTEEEPPPNDDEKTEETAAVDRTEGSLVVEDASKISANSPTIAETITNANHPPNTEIITPHPLDMETPSPSKPSDGKTPNITPNRNYKILYQDMRRRYKDLLNLRVFQMMAGTKHHLNTLLCLFLHNAL